jgi:hypothetical protein
MRGKRLIKRKGWEQIRRALTCWFFLTFSHWSLTPLLLLLIFFFILHIPFLHPSQAFSRNILSNFSHLVIFPVLHLSNITPPYSFSLDLKQLGYSAFQALQRLKLQNRCSGVKFHTSHCIVLFTHKPKLGKGQMWESNSPKVRVQLRSESPKWESNWEGRKLTFLCRSHLLRLMLSLLQDCFNYMESTPFEQIVLVSTYYPALRL